MGPAEVAARRVRWRVVEMVSAGSAALRFKDSTRCWNEAVKFILILSLVAGHLWRACASLGLRGSTRFWVTKERPKLNRMTWKRGSRVMEDIEVR